MSSAKTYRVEQYRDVEFLPDVEFRAEPARGGRDFLQCSGCHRVDTATAVYIPHTLYHNQGRDLLPSYDGYWFCTACMEKLRKAVERRGAWIGHPECLRFDGAYSDDHIVCSECMEVFSILDNDTERFKYCPNCGARMDGEGGLIHGMREDD